MSVDLAELKTMLLLKTDDFDDVLALIIKNTESRLAFLLGVSSSTDIPAALSYIALEVCVRRFNRLKNEGMDAYSQEGESITFSSSDFTDYLDDINTYKQDHDQGAKSLGRVSFFNGYGG